MKKPWQVLAFNVEAKRKIAKQLEMMPEIFPLGAYPQLSSLVTCLGIQNEMGHPNLDRLSGPLGVPLGGGDNPWTSEIIIHRNRIGVALTPAVGVDICPLEGDLGYVLDPLSFDSDGKLAQVVIFPLDVFDNYARRGFELVIVKRWAVSAFLKEGEGVNYLLTNEWEVRHQTALQQAELMTKTQIAFSGTHDIADHLLGADVQKFQKEKRLYQWAQEVFEIKFGGHREESCTDLLLGYAVGVVLDDMAQPKLYGSRLHRALLIKLLEALRSNRSRHTLSLNLPDSFHRMFGALRASDNKSENHLWACFHQFLYDIDFRTRDSLREPRQQKTVGFRAPETVSAPARESASVDGFRS